MINQALPIKYKSYFKRFSAVSLLEILLVDALSPEKSDFEL
jgi:hypothetical protein